jgi:hypothetical protein
MLAMLRWRCLQERDWARSSIMSPWFAGTGSDHRSANRGPDLRAGGCWGELRPNVVGDSPISSSIPVSARTGCSSTGAGHDAGWFALVALLVGDLVDLC